MKEINGMKQKPDLVRDVMVYGNPPSPTLSGSKTFEPFLNLVCTPPPTCVQELVRLPPEKLSGSPYQLIIRSVCGKPDIGHPCVSAQKKPSEIHAGVNRQAFWGFW